ncbi:universal stress protein [Fulvivirga lutimaris]|uniref:universal stress protein n=1 Tax=Fulvivirga lutimaris TaxID=1819566 RepID=UPI0012BC8E43|nr:universal stress protein [Fulvivirga lutimaris]MTI39462.1 universal stress protein [Fulvivirga lutimaris]
MKAKKILCAIDKSASALNAYYFAEAWAARHHMQVNIIHSIGSERLKPEIINAAKKEMIDFTIKNNIDLPVQFVNGEICDVVNELKYDFDLVVMGKKGENHTNKYYGSNAAQVMQTIDLPVFLISEAPTDITFKQILFITDFKDIDKEERLEFIRELALENDSELHLLHISGDGRILNEEEMNEVREMHDIFNDVNHAYFALENEDIISGIKEHIKGHDPSLLVLIPRRTTRLSSTLSQAIVDTDINLPIFSIHA